MSSEHEEARTTSEHCSGSEKVEKLNRDQDIGAEELYAQLGHVVGDVYDGSGFRTDTRISCACDHVHVHSWKGDVNVQLAPGEENAEIGVTFTPDQALAMASALYEATFYAKSFKDHDVVLRNGLAGGDE